MKKIVPFLIIVVLIAVIVSTVLFRAKEQQTVTVYEGNTAKKPVEVQLKRFQDTQCGMAIGQLEDSAQVVGPDGKTWFFDDVGCMVAWLQSRADTFKADALVWVYARDVSAWIDGRTAWYSVTDETPMRYGFAPYKKRKEGFITFEQVTTRMLNGETMKDPRIRKKLLGND